MNKKNKLDYWTNFNTIKQENQLLIEIPQDGMNAERFLKLIERSFNNIFPELDLSFSVNNENIFINWTSSKLETFQEFLERNKTDGPKINC